MVCAGGEWTFLHGPSCHPNEYIFWEKWPQGVTDSVSDWVVEICYVAQALKPPDLEGGFVGISRSRSDSFQCSTMDKICSSYDIGDAGLALSEF